MQDWIVPLAAGVLALVALGLGLALLHTRSRTDRELATNRAETAALRAQLDELEYRLARPEHRTAAAAAGDTARDTEFLITRLGEPESDEPRPVTAPSSALFTDLVVRETVVKAASLAHGVRRALAPESRNRIRFEMRREVKRARKQRRADTRQARREGEARERAGLHEDPKGSAA